jgi:transcriptional regulator GlxA family with amidase domain
MPTRRFRSSISALKRQVRLQSALGAAERSTLNVAAIDAGFYDASHFHRACVAELDLKASALRRLIWPS